MNTCLLDIHISLSGCAELLHCGVHGLMIVIKVPVCRWTIVINTGIPCGCEEIPADGV